MIHASRITNEYNRSTSSPYPFPTNKHYIDGQELTFKQPVNDRVEIDLRRRVRHENVAVLEVVRIKCACGSCVRQVEETSVGDGGEGRAAVGGLRWGRHW